MKEKMYNGMYSRLSLLPLKAEIQDQFAKLCTSKVYILNNICLVISLIDFLITIAIMIFQHLNGAISQEGFQDSGLNILYLGCCIILWFVGLKCQYFHYFGVAFLPLVFSIVLTEKLMIWNIDHLALYWVLSGTGLLVLFPVLIPINFFYTLILALISMVYPVLRLLYINDMDGKMLGLSLIGFCISTYFNKEAFSENLCRFLHAQSFKEQWKRTLLDLPLGITMDKYYAFNY